MFSWFQVGLQTIRRNPILCKQLDIISLYSKINLTPKLRDWFLEYSVSTDSTRHLKVGNNMLLTKPAGIARIQAPACSREKGWA